MLTAAIITPFLPLFPAHSLVIALAVIGAVSISWLVRFPSLGLIFLLASIVAGQTVRLPLPGQGGGLLISDVATVIIEVACLVSLLLRPKSIPQAARISGLILTPFIIWSLATLIVHAPSLGVAGSLISFSYWLRLCVSLLLTPCLLFLFSEERLAGLGCRGLLASMVIVVVLGFAQLLLFPDLRGIAGAGWDPHQGRLVSTWLDPNFFGVLLAMTLPWVVLQVWQKRSLGYYIILILHVGALLLTQSRSSFLALAVVAILCIPFALLYLLRRPRPQQVGGFIAVGGLVIILLTAALAGLGSRSLAVLRSDPTVSLRVDSWQQAWGLIEKNPWLGVGYNAYQFAASSSPSSNNYTVHSRAGSDSSLLNVWVTTGFIGVLIYLGTWTVGAAILLRRSFAKDWLAATVLLGLGILFIDAQFINSAFYSHILIVVAFLLAFTFTPARV
jgi:O-antigen ligase